MKNFLLLLVAAFLIGCQPPSVTPVVPPIVNPVPVNPAPVPVPSAITENDDGKSFVVSKDTVITLTLKVNMSEDFFWAFSKLSGDFEVMSDTRRGSVQTLKLKVGGTGTFALQYCQFADGGLVVLSNLNFSVKVQ